MTTYVVTTGNWNDPLFWQAVSETTTGHALDFSGLGAAFDVQVDQSNGIVTVSDGLTTFTVGEAGVVGTDANFGGTTLLDFFTILSGSSGGDALDGTSGANMISGNSGDDTITYGEGADTVYGGDGNDLIDDAPGVNSTSAGNQIFADAGNDTVYGSAGNDTLYGGTDNDTLSGEGGADQIYGEDGLDRLNGGAGEDFINGGAGADLIFGGADADHLEGGWQDDASDTIWAGTGNDLVFGYGGGDSLYGEDGDDWIDGGAGDDYMEGNAGQDRILGDLGSDTILGGAGYDVLTGGEGADSIDGGDDADQIWGNAGDTIFGGEGGDDNDTLYVSHVDFISYTTAESGTITFNSGDTLSFSGIEVVTELTPDGVVDGTAGADQIGQFYHDADGEWIDNGDAIGEGDGDSVRAGDGNDTIWAHDGNDTVHGEAGDDYIYLGSGDNVAFGGSGADSIDGEWQNDTISGDDFVATGPNLIVNGSFEDTTGMTPAGYGFFGPGGVAPGWTDANGNQIEFDNTGRNGLTATDGANWLDMEASIGQNMVVSQTVAGIDDGQVYLLRFDLADKADGDDGTTLDNQLQVIWNGEVVGSIDSLDGSWRSYEFHLIGGSGDGSNTLTFAGSGRADNQGASLDNVQMYEAAEAVGGADSIDAWDGNDDIMAGAGNDTILAGDGHDMVVAGSGNDSVVGSDGFDTIYGGDGNDNIDGGSGSDSITAGAGNDTVQGGFGNDTIFGGVGSDSITDSGGVTSFDSIDGGTGNDTIDGGLGDDTIVGGQGDDTIDGGSQNDLLYGDHSDPGTSYYITSYGELYQYEPATGTSTLLHTRLEPYGDIATGPDGTLYGVVFSEAAASDAGIYRIDPDTGTETLVIDLPEGTEYHASLAADGAGNLYVNNDTTGTVTRYEPDGLGGFTSAGSVGTIVFFAKDIVFIDDSTAWVTANGNIYQYDVDGSGNFSNEVNLGTINVGQVDIFGLSLSEDGTVYAYEGSGEVWSTDPGVQPLVWSAEAATDLGAGVQLWGTAHLAFTGGNDSIDGGDGDDTIFGGAGNDTLTAGNNTGAGDSLVGGDGDDVITDSFWNATLEGGDGADLFNVGYGTATVSGGEGGTDNDTLSFAVANDPANVTLNADEAGFYIDNDGDSGIFTGIEAFELTSGNDTLDAVGDTTGIEVYAGDGADSISGGSGNDSIDGDGGNDTLRGGQGSDTITGGDGINYLYGNEGNDSLIGSNTDIGGFTEMQGGDGADTLDGTAGDWDIAQYYNSASAVDVDLTDGLTETGGEAQGDTLSGIEQIDGSNLGNDTIVGDAGVQEIKGWGGDDDLTLNSATGGTAYGGDGSDTITGTAGDDTLDGDDGLATGGADSILAGAGNDQIIGDAGNDSLYGEAGNDTIYAGDGSDYIDGGADADVLEGQADGDTFRILDTSGNDTIRGGETFTTGSDNDSINAFSVTSGVNATFDGNETGDLTFGATSVDFSEIEHLTLTDQNDTVNAAADGSGIEVWAYGGNDSVAGGSGNDTLYGMDGADTLAGGGGNDTIIGGDGNDSLLGGSGNDTLLGQVGNDTLTGGDGADELRGGLGDDLISDGAGDDTVFGGEGDDTFIAGAGNDRLEGLEDADTFVVTDGFGNDTISGGDTFTTGANYDTIDLSAVTNPVSVLFDGPGSGTITDSVTGDVITFSGIEQLILTDGNDTVDATLDDGYTYIQTLAGDDSVQGSAGDDIYDDEAAGPDGQGNDTFIGGDGNDQIWAGTGDDSVSGGLGDDRLAGQSGNDTIDGGAGADSLYGVWGDDSITGGDGDDLIVESSPGGTVVGAGDTVTGTDLNDSFVFAGATGTSATIVLDGGSGTANDGDIEYDQVFVTSTGDGAALTLEGFSYGVDRILVSEPWSGLSSTEIAPGQHQVTLTYDNGNSQTFDIFHDNGSVFDPALVMFTYAGNDTLEGGAGNDTISGAFGADLITGGTGNDSIDLGAGDGVADTVVMSDGDGNDTISGFEVPTPDGDGTFTGLDQIDASGLTSDGGTTPVTTADVTVTDDGSGNAVLGFPSGDSLTLIGVAPSVVSDPDALVAMGIPDGRDHVVEGTALGDVIDAAYAGDPEGDMVDSNDGNPLAPGPAGGDADSITAGSGGDTVEAGAGNDTVLGEAGADSISGGAGDDSIDGGTENDWLSGGAHNDTVSGGDGADSVFGDTGDDSLLGGAGNDSMEGWFGNDTIDGGADNDYIDGADGDDILIGGTGNDTLLGGNDAGADSLDGGAGDDDLSAGDGADTLVGGTGADSMFAGGGDDVFVIEDDFGNDTIDGWSTGETAGDSIDAGAVTQDLTLDLSQGDAGSGESGTLSNGTQTAQFIEIESVTLGSGNDSVIGSAGGDTVRTGAGNDTVNAGDGADSIAGGAGNDSIFVDQGDTVSGGDGDDYFTLQDLDTSGTGNAAITITGGEGGETGGDTLQLTPDVSFADITFSNTDDATGGLSGSFTMADGTLVSFSEIENIICFTPGTMILTGQGERAIETLELGDLVVTRDHGLRPIRWIGKRTVKGTGRFAPVRVGAGAMDGARTGLLVSPQHRILFTGYKAELLFGEPEVLVPAKHLIDGREVIQVEQDEVTYIHIMFDCHEVIYAEGIATESFHAGDVGLSAICEAAREELFAIFPELRSAPGHHRDTARPCLKKHEARLLTRDGDGLEVDFL